MSSCLDVLLYFDHFQISFSMNRYIVAAALFCAATVFSIDSRAQATADTVKKISVKVTNLHCNNDMPTIKKRLLNQDGIDKVEFTDIAGETSVFTIVFHSSVTDQDRIEKYIETTPGCDAQDETPYRVKRSRKKSAQ